MSTEFLNFNRGNIQTIPSTSGVYIIKNILNNKTYVGSSLCVRRRLKDHLRKLLHDKHGNKHLQSAFNKYGQTSFQFAILEYCEPVKDTILFIEQKYLDLNPEYNNAKCAKNNAGWHHTKESIAKIVKNRIGKPRPVNIKNPSPAVKIKNSNYINKNRTIPVDQYTLDGVYIRSFYSISFAARSINRRKEGIRDCCKGRQLSAYGYIWKYKQNDYAE